MSKIEISKNSKFFNEIDNNFRELNNHFVFVDKEQISILDKNNIEYFTFTSDNYFIVKRGRRKKRFNQEQQKEIFEDLEQGLSIRKCAEKYKCCTKIIQQIKKGIY